MSPILESPEASLGSVATDAAVPGASPTASASPENVGGSVDAVRAAGTDRVAFESASEPLHELPFRSGLPLADLAAEQVESAEALSPLQRLLALCDQARPHALCGI